VDRGELDRLLQDVAAGAVTPSAAGEQLRELPFADLGFARVDTHRALRTGDPEVVYGAGKTPEQTVAIVAALQASGSAPTLVTRAGAASVAAIRDRWPDCTVGAGPDGATVVVGDLPAPRGLVAVVAAGTSDGAVADESALTAAAFGAGVSRITDVGVAGLHRILAVRPELEAADCIVVVAGMEGALPSVVGGLVGTPVVAVPTSVGYGAAFDGLAALLGMLTACAPGIVVSNIDNGFGAGVFAARVARRQPAGDTS
jgi:NCAIR mutase (PurE)-related protein